MSDFALSNTNLNRLSMSIILSNDVLIQFWAIKFYGEETLSFSTDVKYFGTIRTSALPRFHNFFQHKITKSGSEEANSSFEYRKQILRTPDVIQKNFIIIPNASFSSRSRDELSKSAYLMKRYFSKRSIFAETSPKWIIYRHLMGWLLQEIRINWAAEAVKETTN